MCGEVIYTLHLQSNDNVPFRAVSIYAYRCHLVNAMFCDEIYTRIKLNRSAYVTQPES